MRSWIDKKKTVEDIHTHTHTDGWGLTNSYFCYAIHFICINDEVYGVWRQGVSDKIRHHKKK